MKGENEYVGVLTGSGGHDDSPVMAQGSTWSQIHGDRDHIERESGGADDDEFLNIIRWDIILTLCM